MTPYSSFDRLSWMVPEGHYKYLTTVTYLGAHPDRVPKPAALAFSFLQNTYMESAEIDGADGDVSLPWYG
jgi:hypothetical protein